MSSIYGGDGSIVTVAGFTPKSIVSSTNATPIVLEVTGHGYLTGDFVEVESHGVNTSANGQWVITVSDANHFALNGSVGIGVGPASGYVNNYAVKPQVTIPSDGDLRNASSVNVPLEAGQDKIAQLYRLAGKYRLWNVYEARHDDATSVVNNTTWSNTTRATADWGYVQNMPVTLAPAVTLQQFNVNDLVEMELQTSAIKTAGAARLFIAWGYTDTTGTTARKITGSEQTMIAAYDGPINLKAHLACANADLNVGTGINFGVIIYGDAGSPPTLHLNSDWRVTINHYRRN